MAETRTPIISFKNFSFQYRAQKQPTLHDINLDKVILTFFFLLLKNRKSYKYLTHPVREKFACITIGKDNVRP